jgi:multidrug efflux pump
MHLSAPFIKRPVATSLLSFALLLAGAVAYNFLPVASLPEVELPTIQVSAGLPGASPETMASSVATPLERQFGRIAGITQMTSSSQTGSASVTLQFDLSRNIDAAARDVQAAINAARSQLPANLPQNPSYRKVNPADAPIVMFNITSDVVPRGVLYDLADSVIAQKISQVPGVSQVGVWGSSSPSVRAELNPMQLSSYGVGLEQVRTVLGNANANRPKGSFQDTDHQWSIQTNDQMFKASEYAPLIVYYNPQTGAPVRLRDLGEVEDSVADLHNAGLANGKPSIILAVMKIPGANVIDTCDRVKAEIVTLRAALPPTVNMDVAIDRTTTIRASVKDVERTLIISVLLVVLVVFVFLREVWSTVIPSIAVPLSLVGTFGVMYLLGYTLDNYSLMALTIATGFVVDDAIVVIENIMRYLEAGMEPFAAAMRGSREIGFTVVSMSLSLIAVFIPILLMGGIVGRFFREFSVTLSVAILVSLMVSLTTTPMMCAKFLKVHDPNKARNFIYRTTEGFFNYIHREYLSGLRWVLRHPALMLAVTIGTCFLSVYLYIVVPKGLFPQQDTGRLMGSLRASQDISFDAMRIKQRQLTEIVMKDPAVQTVDAFIGGGSINIGRMFISLKPLAERKVSSDEVINRLRKSLNSVPGAQLFLQTAQDLSTGGRGSDSQYQYTLSDDNLNELMGWAPKMQALLAKQPLLRDVSTDQQNQGLEAELVVDRDTASRLGITAANIDNVLYDAFGQRQVSTMYQELNQYHVVMEVAHEYQNSPDSLNGIYLTSSTGAQIPLSSFAHYEPHRSALQVNHQGQYPAVTLSFNLAPGASLSDAVNAIDDVQSQLNMPATVHSSFQGTAQTYQASLANEPYLILTALIAVYIVLGMLYESLIHPLTIISTLPSAGVGALLALIITHTELSLLALIGILLLIGIVKKNAIMMIDFALLAEREEGLSSRDAIYKACQMRFRPIMMTTMAALLGGLPIALGTGVGSELRRPLGITIVGGLIVSQMLTLFTTPVIYLFFDKLQSKVQKLHKLDEIETIMPVQGN